MRTSQSVFNEALIATEYRGQLVIRHRSLVLSSRSVDAKCGTEIYLIKMYFVSFNYPVVEMKFNDTDYRKLQNI